MINNLSPEHSWEDAESQTRGDKIRAYLAWVVKDQRKELSYVLYWKILLGLLIGGAFQYLHVVASNYAYVLADNHRVYGGVANRLVDLGFIQLADAPDLSFFPNFCLYLVGALSVAFGITAYFTRDVIRNPIVRPIQMLWRSVLVASIAITLRCSTFLITIVPAPAEHCAMGTWDPPTTKAEIFTRFDNGGGCGDLIFSGHMMYGIIAALAVTHYTVIGMRGMKTDTIELIAKLSFVLICWGIVAMEAVSIVQQHVHYSVDVLVASYSVPLIWIAFYHFVPTDPVPPCIEQQRIKVPEIEMAPAVLDGASETN